MMDASDASYRIIADLLEARTGQTLAENRRWRVATALSGLFREFDIYNVDQLACLLERPGEQRLATRVVEALLNNETYFFRDQAYFTRVAEEVLPALAERRAASRRLAIWSAGCSTGQELLSIAMLLDQQADQWADWTIDLVGTDVSMKAVEQARGGVYSQFEVQRGLGVAQMLTYFAEAPRGWKVSDSIHQRCRFDQHNILNRPPAPHRFDFIMCRNVLLYFDAATRAAACARLASGLARDGFLMLGAGETGTGTGPDGDFVPTADGAFHILVD